MVRINRIIKNIEPPKKCNEPRRTPNGNIIGCAEGSNDAPTIEKLIMDRKKTDMKTLNLNDIIKVKLTDAGMDIYYHHWDEFNARCGQEIIKPSYPIVDEDGFVKFQLWYFMEIYGRHMSLTSPQFIEDNNIYIYEKDLREV